MTKTLAAMLVFDTDGDPLLTDDKRFHLACQSPEGMEAVRAAVIDKLRRDSTRLIFVTAEETARLMVYAHMQSMKAFDEADKVHLPPTGYVPPADRR